MTFYEIFSLALQGLTFAAIATGVLQLLNHSRQLHRDLEVLYVERYWELMDRRSRSFALGRKPTKDDAVVADQYLQLCEDEIDLRRLGRVTDSTWFFWDEAIRSQVSQYAYLKALESSGSRYQMLTDFWSLRTESRSRRDPLLRGRFWRVLHGL